MATEEMTSCTYTYEDFNDDAEFETCKYCCAEELVNEILRLTGNLVENAELGPAITAAQSVIAKHFPPAVPVEKLRTWLKEMEYARQHIKEPKVQLMLDLLIRDIEALIAEAEQ